MAVTLKDLTFPVLEAKCPNCAKRWSIPVRRLIAVHGPDKELPELFRWLANGCTQFGPNDFGHCSPYSPQLVPKRD